MMPGDDVASAMRHTRHVDEREPEYVNRRFTVSHAMMLIALLCHATARQSVDGALNGNGIVVIWHGNIVVTTRTAAYGIDFI